MTKRIDQLAAQAKIKWQHQEDVIYSTMTLEQFEKFAQMIVKECAQIADDGFASSNFGNGITGHQLLKHFGVEE